MNRNSKYASFYYQVFFNEFFFFLIVFSIPMSIAMEIASSKGMHDNIKYDFLYHWLCKACYSNQSMFLSNYAMSLNLVHRKVYYYYYYFEQSYLFGDWRPLTRENNRHQKTTWSKNATWLVWCHCTQIETKQTKKKKKKRKKNGNAFIKRQI